MESGTKCRAEKSTSKNRSKKRSLGTLLGGKKAMEFPKGFGTKRTLGWVCEAQNPRDPIGGGKKVQNAAEIEVVSSHQLLSQMRPLRSVLCCVAYHTRGVRCRQKSSSPTMEMHSDWEEEGRFATAISERLSLTMPLHADTSNSPIYTNPSATPFLT